MGFQTISHACIVGALIVASFIVVATQAYPTYGSPRDRPGCPFLHFSSCFFYRFDHCSLRSELVMCIDSVVVHAFASGSPVRFSNKCVAPRWFLHQYSKHEPNSSNSFPAFPPSFILRSFLVRYNTISLIFFSYDLLDVYLHFLLLLFRLIVQGNDTAGGIGVLSEMPGVVWVCGSNNADFMGEPLKGVRAICLVLFLFYCFNF
jgi:hypothetical protein